MNVNTAVSDKATITIENMTQEELELLRTIMRSCATLITVKSIRRLSTFIAEQCEEALCVMDTHGVKFTTAEYKQE